MIRSRFVLFSAILFSTVAAHGQTRDSAEVKLLVQPFHQVQFILNGTERLKEVDVPAVRLTAGDHRLIFWAPNCGILDTTLHVIGGTDMEMRKVLKQTPEFLAYKRDRSHVGMKKALWKGIPLLFTIGFGLKALSDHKAHDQAFDDLHALRDSYATQTSPSTIEALKRTSIPDAQDELDATRHQLIVSLTLCGASALVTIYGFIHAGKLAYPEYEDKEKVKFEGLAWTPRNGGMYLAGISIPIR